MHIGESGYVEATKRIIKTARFLESEYVCALVFWLYSLTLCWTPSPKLLLFLLQLFFFPGEAIACYLLGREHWAVVGKDALFMPRFCPVPNSWDERCRHLCLGDFASRVSSASAMAEGESGRTYSRWQKKGYILSCWGACVAMWADKLIFFSRLSSLASLSSLFSISSWAYLTLGLIMTWVPLQVPMAWAVAWFFGRTELSSVPIRSFSFKAPDRWTECLAPVTLVSDFFSAFSFQGWEKLTASSF